MSLVLYKTHLIPDLNTRPVDLKFEVMGDHFSIANTIKLENSDKELGQLPDRRAARAMGRSSLLLSAVGLQTQEILSSFIKKDCYRVGLYCAIDNGPDDYQCIQALMNTNESEFATIYKKNRSPKQYLKQLPNLAGAQLGIFLGIQGPLNVFIHSQYGPLHALEQAEFDLNNNLIDAALVCAAFSLEDPLLCHRVRKDYPGEAVLTEGAAALVLVSGGEKKNWSELTSNVGNISTSKRIYGIADLLINYCIGGDKNERTSII